MRGSAGFGKTFLKLDNGMKREDSVKDIGALIDWIARQPDLDASRIMITGGSYGGYMSLAVAMHFADRIAGAIDVVGISNFVTFLEHTESYRRDLRRVEYGDERDPAMRAFLEGSRRSTTRPRSASRSSWSQGKNDPRVPYTEAEQIVADGEASGAPRLVHDGQGRGPRLRRRSPMPTTSSTRPWSSRGRRCSASAGDDMDAVDILAFGEAMVEFNQTGAGGGRLYLQGFGGDSSNFAIAAARQGARVGYLCAARRRRQWRACCAISGTSEGIEQGGVAPTATAFTAVYFVTHDAAGHDSASSAAARRRAGSPRRSAARAIAAAKVLHLSGISLAISASALRDRLRRDRSSPARPA